MRTLGSYSKKAASTRPVRVRDGAIALSVAFSLGLGACSNQKAAAAAQSESSSAVPAAAPATGDLPATLATVGTENITLADVRGRVGEQLDQLDMQYKRTRDKIIGSALDSLLHERLIAEETKKTGKTADQLLAEVNGSALPTEIEIAAWYTDNQARLGGKTLDQLRPQISDLLAKQRKAEATAKLEERLRRDHAVKVAFEPYRVKFSNDGAPTLGKKDAPVTLVEFSDFQCPYCQAAAPVLKQVTQKFGDKVQIVYRQYPIPSLHPFAFKAAEASLCANEQGKFWALHDAMFEDQKKLAVSDLKATAKRLGMDSQKFDGCLDSGRYVERVQNDMKDGSRIGVNGTPAMFINGTYVEGGSVPFSTLEALINKELSRINPKS